MPTPFMHLHIAEEIKGGLKVQPGEPSNLSGILDTVEVYAMRLQMTSEVFAAKLEDGVWLQKNLFAHVPITFVQEILAAAVPASIL